MNLHLWNAKAGTIWKMNGDIDLAVTNVGSAIGGGLCIGFPEDEARFDCIEYGIILDTDTLADSNSMTVSFVDSYMAAGPSLKADERSNDDSSSDTVDPAKAGSKLMIGPDLTVLRVILRMSHAPSLTLASRDTSRRIMPCKICNSR